MSNRSRLKVGEVIFLCLPVLVFVVWALLSHEEDVRENISGRWRNEAGVFAFRVHGNELFISQNGKPDKRRYRFLSDNAIEVTDNAPSKYRPTPLIYVTKVRIHWGVMEMTTNGDTAKARRIGD